MARGFGVHVSYYLPFWAGGGPVLPARSWQVPTPSRVESIYLGSVPALGHDK